MKVVVIQVIGYLELISRILINGMCGNSYFNLSPQSIVAVISWTDSASDNANVRLL